MRKLLLLLGLLGLLTAMAMAIPTTSYAATPPPSLCFTDLDVAGNTGMIDNLPSNGFNHGAIVTVWGHNLGSSQGSSTITVGGVAPSYIYYWKNADGNLPGGPSTLSAMNMQEIAFALSPSTPASSSGTSNNIVVTVGGVSTPPLAITVVSGYTSTITSSGGNFIFFSNSGSDSSGCGTFASPCATIDYYGQSGNGSNTGQTYYNKGNYTLSGTGTNSEGLVSLSHDCTAINPCSVVAYPNTTLLINSSNTYATADTAINGFNSASTPLTPGLNPNGQSQYWKLCKITSSVDGFFSENMGAYQRIIGCSLSCTDYLHSAAGIIGGWASASAIYGNTFHNIFGAGNAQTGGNGPDNQTHVLYFTHRHWDTFPTPLQPILVGWNYFYNNTVRFAVHFYDEDHCGLINTGSQVHDNWLELEDGAGVGFTGFANGCENGCSGTGCYSGTLPTGLSGTFYQFSLGEVDVYNNVFNMVSLNRNGASASYMGAFYLGGPLLLVNVKAYNNTVWSNGQSLVSGATYTSCIADATSGSGSPDNPSFCTNILLVDHACGYNSSITFTNNIDVDVLGQAYYYSYNASSGSGQCSPFGLSTAVQPTGKNNLWYSSYSSPPSAPAWDTHPITGNPNFVSTPGNLNVNTGSPALSSGSPTIYPTYDIVGNLRPNPPSAGAYDISGGSSLPSWLKGGYWWQYIPSHNRKLTSWCYSSQEEDTGVINNPCRNDQ